MCASGGLACTAAVPVWSGGDSGVSEINPSFGNLNSWGIFGTVGGSCVSVDCLVSAKVVLCAAECPAGGAKVPGAMGLVGSVFEALGFSLPLSSDGAGLSSLALLGSLDLPALTIPEVPGAS